MRGINVRLHTENQHSNVPRNALKVPVVVAVGGWWVCKPILVFYFGPNQAFAFALGLDWNQDEQQLKTQ